MKRVNWLRNLQYRAIFSRRRKAAGRVRRRESGRVFTAEVCVLEERCLLSGPVGTSNTITMLVNGTYQFQQSDWGFNEAGYTMSGLTITTAPSSGTLQYYGNDGDLNAVTAGMYLSNKKLSNGLIFTPAANASGTPYASFTFQVNDNAGVLDASPKTITMNVQGVNHAPLGASTTVTTLENTPYALLTTDFGFTDPGDTPANTLLAVKLTTLPAAGTLADNGAAVTAGQFITASDIAAGKLVFTPATFASGIDYTSFTFQAEDNGGTVNGGIDLDPSAKTLTIDVTHVNQAPAGASTTVLTAKNTAYTLQSADFGFTDPNDSPADPLAAVMITTLPTAGALTDNGAAVTVGQPVSLADITAGLLVFTPQANAVASPYDSFTFQVQDGGGTANGGVNTDPTPRTLTVNVLESIIVNHAPAGTSTAVTTLENLPYVIQSADFGFTDSGDSPANQLLSVKIATLPGAGTLTNNGAAVTAGQYISAGDISGGKLVFTPAAFASGTAYASLTFQVRDDGGTIAGGVDLDPTARTLTFNVTHVNQAPVGSSNTVTTSQNAAYTFQQSDFLLADPNDSPANHLLAVKIATLPTAGTLTDNGAAATAGQFVSASEIAAGKLVFAPSVGASGAPYGSFTFQVEDDGGTANGGVDTDPTARTMAVNVVFVNHAPIGTPNTISLQANADYQFTVADFGFSDPGDNPANTFNGLVVTSLPASGTLWIKDNDDEVHNVAAGQFLFSSQISSSRKGFFFTPAAGGGSTSFTFQVQDNGGTLNGGVNTDPTPRTMSLSVPNVNHAPAGTSTTVTTLENSPYTLQTSDFGFTDPDDSPANALLAVKIASLPTAGALADNGSAVAAGQLIPASDIAFGKLLFTPAMYASGAAYASLTFQVEDDGGTANGGIDLDPAAKTLTIAVTHVNQAPAGTPGSVTLWQSTTYAFQQSDFGFTDPNDTPANMLAGVTIATLPAAGSLTDNGVAVTAGQLVSAGEIASGKLVYAPSANDTGSPYATFAFQVEDDGGTANGGKNVDATPRTMAINVSPLVAPLLSGASTLNYAPHDLPKPIDPAITITSPASPTLASATIAVANFVASDDLLAFANDNVTMGNIAGLFDNSTGVLALSSVGGTATIAQWQKALQSVTYFNQSALPDTTARTVTFTVDDGQATNPVSNTLASTVDIASLAAPPQVSGLSTDTGATAGGTSVTITGTGFNQVSSVLFGAASATSFTVDSPTSITAIAPAGHSGAVDVIIVALAGSSAITQNDRFTYQDPVGLPTVTSVSPGTASASGGDAITIRGTDFTGVTAVTFDGTVAASFTVTSPTTITAIAPAHVMGQVDIQVTTGVGTSAAAFADRLTFVAPVSPPSVTGLTSSTGSTSGGVYVNILGTNFANVSAVTFGSVDATWFTVNSAGSITALVPAAFAGTVDVTVTNSAGTSATSAVDQYTYESRAPVVSGLSRASGSTDGGTSVTIRGSNFEGTSSVQFGDLPATRFSVIDSNTILAVAPPEDIGTIDVTVESINGVSTTTLADQFSYIAPPPVVTGLSVSSGLLTGGTSVTISGANLAGATGVFFGAAAASAFFANPDGTLTAIAPALPLGTVDVTVANASGASDTSLADQFTFINPPPVVAALSVATGSHEGGTVVTITGSRFLGTTGVYFGQTRAGSFTVSDDGTITVIAPAEAPATVDVTVDNASGTSATSSADLFTFDLTSAPGGSTPGNPAAALDLPAVIDLDSGSGPIAGGQSVTIYGYNLTGATSVLFGALPAASFVVNSDSSITAVAPAAPAGRTPITVVSPAGTSTAAPGGAYDFYDPAAIPSVLSVTLPSEGALAGALVTIDGADFNAVTGVSFGDVSAVYYVESPTRISALIPAGLSGSVNVAVTNDNGVSPATPGSAAWIDSPAAAGAGTAGPVLGGGSASLPAGFDLVTDPTSGFPTFSGAGTAAFDAFFAGSFSAPSGSSAGVGFVDSLPTPGTVDAPWLLAIEALPIANGMFRNHDNPQMTGATAHQDDYAAHTFSISSAYSGSDTFTNSVTIPQADGSVFTATISQTLTEWNSSAGGGHLDQHDDEKLDHSTSISHWALVETFTYALTMPNGSGYKNTWQSSRVKDSVCTVDGAVTTTIVHTVEQRKLTSHDVALAGGLTGTQDSLSSERFQSDTTTVAATGVSPYQKVTNTSKRTGGDNYSQKSSLGAAASVTQSSLRGSDKWSWAYTGNDDYEQSGSTFNDTVATTNSGTDQYATRGETHIDTTTPEGTGAVVLHEVENNTDAGTDQYDTTDTQTIHDYFPAGATAAISTRIDNRTDNFSGKEQATSGDNGFEEVNFTSDNGATISELDKFNDFQSDTDQYSIGDDESENSNAGGDDDVKLSDDDHESFNTGDSVTGTVTWLNAYNTPTTANITDKSGDVGTLDDDLSIEDDETLGPASEDLGEKIKMDDPLKEQDTANDELSIQIALNGLVGAGVTSNFQETFELKDKSPNSVSYDDPLTDEWAPTNDKEADNAAFKQKSGDEMTITDVAHGVTTYPDGSTETDDVDNSQTENVTFGEDDTENNVDTEIGAPDANPTDTDDLKHDDKTTFDDQYTEHDKTTAVRTTPLPGGSMTQQSVEELDVDDGELSDNEENVGENKTGSGAYEQDIDKDESKNTDSGKQIDTGLLQVTMTDPATGIVTTLNASDNDEDDFTDDDTDSTDVESGDAPAAVSTVPAPKNTETAVAKSTDEWDDKSTLSYSVVGIIAPGAMIDFLRSANTEDTGTDENTDTYSSTSPGNDTDDDTNDFHDHEIVGSGGHSNFTLNLTTNDGAGSTYTFADSVADQFNEQEEFDEEDDGEEDVTDAAGVIAGDVEHDTDTGSGNLATTETETITKHDSIVTTTTDAAGHTLTTTVNLDLDGATDTITGNSTEQDTDLHDASLTNPGSDVLTGTEDVDSKEVTASHPKQTTSIVGVDSDGNTYDLHETDTEDDDETTTEHAHDVQQANGDNTDQITTDTIVHDKSGVVLTGTMASVGVDGNTHTSTLNLTSTDQIDGNDDYSETDDAPPAGDPTKTTGHTDSVQEKSTWSLNETTNVAATPGSGTNNVSESSPAGQGSGQTGGTSSSLTETGEDDEDDENGVTNQTAASDTVIPSDPSAQAEWSSRQKQLLLDYQQRRAEAVGALLSATKARDEAAGTLFTWPSTVDALNAKVAAAQAEVDKWDAQIDKTFGLKLSDPKLQAGDEALKWSYATKFLLSLQYAWDHDQFTGEMKEQVEELLNTVKDPAAMAQFVAMIGGVALVKKGACKAGLGPFAGAAFTVMEGAEVALTLSAIKSELDGITYSSEVANAAPHVAKFMANLIKDVSFAELIKFIRCFVAGTQVAVARGRDESGAVVYTTRNIEDLQVGDFVLARDEFGDAVQLRRVTDTVRRTAFALQVLEFTDAAGRTQTLRTTPEHPFWAVNHNEFRPAAWLKPGDTFISPDGLLQTLIETESESHPDGVFVYNFTVDIAHTYYVSATKDDLPLLAHNSNCPKAAATPDAGAPTRVHGNTAGNQPATLYKMYDVDGNFLKHGVSQNPSRRYTKKELNGGHLSDVQTGPRSEMLRIERDLVERMPGPLNKERWAGKRLGE